MRPTSVFGLTVAKRMKEHFNLLKLKNVVLGSGRKEFNLKATLPVKGAKMFLSWQ